MTKIGAITLLSVLAVGLVLSLTWKPELLTDENAFFDEFVGQNLLAFMGVILTLSLGLLAQLFLSVAKLADLLDKSAVTEIRDELRSTAKTLVLLFFVSIALFFLKPMFPGNDTIEAIFNAAVVFVVVYYLLILSDVVLSIFDFDV